MVDDVRGRTKNKDAAMKFINELYDPVVSMQVLFGSLGTEHRGQRRRQL